jgi:hypothetical protein
MLVSRTTSNMLNQIGLKSVMDVAIMQSFCDVHELFPRCYLSLWVNQLTLKILALVIDGVIMLGVNNHVLRDHTSSHHIPYPLCAPCSGRVPNNSPPWLKHTKRPLHILLLGFDANNKKFIGYATRIGQELSISNVVMISWRFGDIPL